MRKGSRLKYGCRKTKEKGLPEEMYNPPIIEGFFSLCKDYLPLGLTLSIGILQDLRLG